MNMSELIASGARFFESYPSAEFITTTTVPWTIPALFLIFPILFAACTLQTILILFGPSNVYEGPAFYSRPTPTATNSTSNWSDSFLQILTELANLPEKLNNQKKN